MKNPKAQSAVDFISQYVVSLLVLAVAIVAFYVVATTVRFGASTPQSSYCYITPELNCYQMLIVATSTYTNITIAFTNNLGQSINLSSGPTFYVAPTPSSKYAAGACNETVLKNGATAVCTASIKGFVANVGSQLEPNFYLNYGICSNPACTGASSLQTINTSGSASAYVSSSGTGVEIITGTAGSSGTSGSSGTGSGPGSGSGTGSGTGTGSGGSSGNGAGGSSSNGSSASVITFTYWAVSNATVDIGQTETLTVGWLNGSQPYTAHYLVFNGTGLCINQTYPDLSGTSNSFSYVASASCGVGVLTANVVLTDSKSNTATNTLSFMQNPAPTANTTNKTTGCSFGNCLYVVSTGGSSGNIVLINTSTNKVVGAIGSASYTFDYSVGIGVSPTGAYAYLTNGGSNYRRNSVYNCHIEVIGSNSVCTSPYLGNVLILNTTTNNVTGSINSGFYNPEGVAFSPDGTYAYVANYG